MAPFNGAPGDLIEISRVGFKHWAVYIGGNEVVHLVTNDYNTSGTSSNPFTNYGKVKRHSLATAVGNDNYCVNNLLDDKFTPREPSVIVKAALDMVGQVISYGIATYNCEHFATEMRYGKAESRQAKAGVITYLAVTSLTAVGTLAMVTPVGAVVAAGAAVGWSVAAFKSLFSSNPTARKKK